MTAGAARRILPFYLYR